MELNGHAMARPGRVFAFAGHYVPTANRHLGIEGAGDPPIRGMIERLARDAERHGIRHYGYVAKFSVPNCLAAAFRDRAIGSKEFIDEPVADPG